MLTLNDGRSELWQWDTGRKLTVDADCSQVHFSNKVFGRSIDVDVVGGVAIIPDIMLQTEKDLFAWAFVGTAENGYTKISKVFKVNKRNKPADYVFTPPEQTTLGEIMERLEQIEASQDPDAIKNAVEDYLENNPVEAPVQSVNGYTGKVELTAEDVGAISQDDLQEATNEALAQAKASGEFDGQPGQPGRDGVDGKDGADGYTPVRGTDYWTEADKVEIVRDVLEQVPTGGGSGGSNSLTLLQSADITGVGSVVVTPTTPVRNILVIVKGVKNKTGESALRVAINGNQTGVEVGLGKDGTSQKWCYATFKYNGVMWECLKYPESTNEKAGGTANASAPYYGNRLFTTEASTIRVHIGSTADDYMPTGGTVEIYGG